ncbi:transposase-like protein [Pedobacter sp. CG_S7]|uniref:transposase n=1 Tax=Pedobacter sp. CG_S7 TaxID=3143930 RepID=UPI003390A8AC
MREEYPLSCKSWLDNWLNLSPFFEYDYIIRKINYTINPIEGIHLQIRKITKTKGAFPSEQALMKLIYLVIKNISEKWTMPFHNWRLAFSQLFILFGDRILQEHNSF